MQAKQVHEKLKREVNEAPTGKDHRFTRSIVSSFEQLWRIRWAARVDEAMTADGRIDESIFQGAIVSEGNMAWVSLWKSDRLRRITRAMVKSGRKGALSHEAGADPGQHVERRHGTRHVDPS